MSLSRRELEDLEKTIAAITTENLKTMAICDRAKHSRDVLAAAERELKKRVIRIVPASKEIEDPHGSG
jgi:hypothetical protein